MSELLSNASLKTGYAVADQLAIILDKVKAIMGKMNNKPISLTAEEARFLSEHSTAHDERAVRTISAIENLAIANKMCTTRDLATLRLLTVRC